MAYLIRFSCFAAILCGLALSGAGGCSRDGDAERRQFGELIRSYDDLLSQGYRDMNMAPAGKVVTAEHAARLDHRLAGLKRMNRRMESRLREVAVLDIDRRRDGTAFVTTREKWDIRQLDLPTREVVRDYHGFGYELRYEIVRQNNRWLVNAVTVLKEEKPR